MVQLDCRQNREIDVGGAFGPELANQGLAIIPNAQAAKRDALRPSPCQILPSVRLSGTQAEDCSEPETVCRTR